MREISHEILREWQVRKSGKQKEAFRSWLCGQLCRAGYTPQTERGGLRASHNVVVGDPDKARLLLTAHYDTCAVLPIPNFITPRNPLWYLAYQTLLTLVILAVVFAVTFAATLAGFFLLDGSPAAELIGAAAGYGTMIFCVWWMLDGRANRHTANDNTSGVISLLEIALALPESVRQDVCLVFFDNEERGLLGAKAFARRHRGAARSTLTINFDCVGDGDALHFFRAKAAKTPHIAALLRECFLPEETKQVEVPEGIALYPSDQAAFRWGVGVCALKKSRIFGWYMDRIHTGRDTVLQEENIDLLCAGSVRLAERVAAEGVNYAK